MAAIALRKITAEAKRIRKKHPKTSWKSAVKQAGTKYRAGKIRPKRKRAAVSGVKRKTVRRKAAPRKKARKRSSRPKAVQIVRTVRVTRVGRSAPRRRMAGSGGGFLKKAAPILLLGGVALVAYMLLKPKPAQLPPGAPPLVQTSNTYRNTQTNEILQYALAGGLALDAITRLINSLNNRSDADVQQIYNEVEQGGGLPPTLFV